MKIPYTAALLITLALAATSAFGRELEELKPGAKIQSKSEPGTDYRVREVTRDGVWVEVPKQGGIKGALQGGEGPSGTRRVFIPRDQVSGVGPLAPLTHADFSAKDDFARLRQTLEADASAADRAGNSNAADLVEPMREREALLREVREKTRSQRLRDLLDDHFANQEGMRGFVRRSAEAQLWGQRNQDAPGATEEAWNLSLNGMLDPNPGAKKDLEALEGVRGALEGKVIDDLNQQMERDPAGAHAEAKRLLKTFEGLAGNNPGIELPEDMTKFLRNLQGVRGSTKPGAGPAGVAPPRPVAPEIPALPGPIGPIGPLGPIAPPTPELPGPAAPNPFERKGPADLEAVARIEKVFEDELKSEPENLQGELLEVEAELLKQEASLADAEQSPALIRVRVMLRDTNRHLQRIAGEAIESDPVAFARELYRRGAAYERALRRLPSNLRQSYRTALKQIDGLLARARPAARHRSRPLTPWEGAKKLRQLRNKRAEAVAQGLTGLAEQLRREEDEIRRRVK